MNGFTGTAADLVRNNFRNRKEHPPSGRLASLEKKKDEGGERLAGVDRNKYRDVLDARRRRTGDTGR